MKTAESNFFFDAAVFFMRNYIGKKIRRRKSREKYSSIFSIFAIFSGF